MRVVLIDYGAGNLHSVEKAFTHITGASATVLPTQSASDLENATHLVLPGVGAFADGMKGLEAMPGMRAALEKKIADGIPFLGICVGMQMMFERGHEHGTYAGLDWLKGEVSHLRPTDPMLKIPHMGWNDLQFTQPQHPILNDIQEGEHAYFVHSYHAEGVAEDALVSTVQHGQQVTAIVAKDNMIGVQFHPEKSQQVGLQLLRNFLEMQP